MSFQRKKSTAAGVRCEERKEAVITSPKPGMIQNTAKYLRRCATIVTSSKEFKICVSISSRYLLPFAQLSKRAKELLIPQPYDMAAPTATDLESEEGDVNPAKLEVVLVHHIETIIPFQPKKKVRQTPCCTEA